MFTQPSDRLLAEVSWGYQPLGKYQNCVKGFYHPSHSIDITKTGVTLIENDNWLRTQMGTGGSVYKVN